MPAALKDDAAGLSFHLHLFHGEVLREERTWMKASRRPEERFWLPFLFFITFPNASLLAKSHHGHGVFCSLETGTCLFVNLIAFMWDGRLRRRRGWGSISLNPLFLSPAFACRQYYHYLLVVAWAARRLGDGTVLVGPGFGAAHTFLSIFLASSGVVSGATGSKSEKETDLSFFLFWLCLSSFTFLLWELLFTANICRGWGNMQWWGFVHDHRLKKNTAISIRCIGALLAGC